MSERTSYSVIQIALHWLVAVLVLAAYITGDGMGRLLRARLEGTGDGSWPVHVWLGLSVIAVVVVRWIVKLTMGTPGPVAGTTDLAAKARHWGHLGLYLLLIAVPVGGMLTWFQGIRTIGDLHVLAGNVLIYGAGAHAVIALWHQYWRRDGTLTRMLRPS